MSGTARMFTNQGWSTRMVAGRTLPLRLHTYSFRRHVSIDNRYVKVSEEVQQAVSERRPVVALESTIYTHGFPYPQNMVLATNLESIVRAVGAVPATIGILDGVARVGLDGDDLIRLASSSLEPDSLLKISRRDLSFALSARTKDDRPYTGGTTIAGTMVLAHLAGIKVFATGGLGGVHRGVSETLDISADLTELGRTPVSVIAAGCKAFLDIPKTLEYLETQGVPVATLASGRDGEVDFPGFWSRDSGSKSPMTIRDELVAAQMIVAQHELGLQSGIFFGSPVPQEHEIPVEQIRHSIDAALGEAAAQGMTGNRATPFILAKIKELTGSRSVTTNTVLVENNVRVGAKIAMEVSFLEKYHSNKPRATSSQAQPAMLSTTVSPEQSGPRIISPPPVNTVTEVDQSPPKVFVAGMLAVDLACDYSPRKDSSKRSLELHTSNPGKITQSLGGVGHNVARAIHLCGVETRLLSAIGSDINGTAALEALQSEDMDTSGIAILQKSSGRRTAQYVAVNDENKDLVVAVADMNILEYDSMAADPLEAVFDAQWLPAFQSSDATHLVVDANWSPEYLAHWLNIARQKSTRVLFEPVSNAKSTSLFHLPTRHTLATFPESSIHIATPNEHELSSMYETAQQRGFLERQDWWQVVDAFGIPSSGARAKLVLATSAELVDRGIPQKSIQLLPYVPCVLTKLGPLGVLVTQIIPAGDSRLTDPDYATHMLSRCNNDTEKELGVGGIYMRLCPSAEVVDPADIVSVNGVGDTFAGVLVASLAKAAQQGKPERVEDSIDVAQRASILTLKSSAAVSPGLGVLSVLV